MPGMPAFASKAGYGAAFFYSPRAENKKMAGAAGLEPVTSAVTGQRSNQLSYAPARNPKKLRSRQVNLRK